MLHTLFLLTLQMVILTKPDTIILHYSFNYGIQQSYIYRILQVVLILDCVMFFKSHIQSQKEYISDIHFIYLYIMKQYPSFIMLNFTHQSVVNGQPPHDPLAARWGHQHPHRSLDGFPKGKRMEDSRVVVSLLQFIPNVQEWHHYGSSEPQSVSCF